MFRAGIRAQSREHDVEVSEQGNRGKVEASTFESTFVDGKPCVKNSTSDPNATPMIGLDRPAGTGGPT